VTRSNYTDCRACHSNDDMDHKTGSAGSSAAGGADQERAGVGMGYAAYTRRMVAICEEPTRCIHAFRRKNLRRCRDHQRGIFAAIDLASVPFFGRSSVKASARQRGGVGLWSGAARWPRSCHEFWVEAILIRPPWQARYGANASARRHLQNPEA